MDKVDTVVVDEAGAAGASPATLLEELKSSPAGLTTAEVAERRTECGPNAMTKERATALVIFVRQFQSPLVFLMLAAGLAFVTKDLSDGGIILFILLVTGVLGFSQEPRTWAPSSHPPTLQ